MNTENFKPLRGIDLKFIEEKQQEIKFKYEPESKFLFDNFDIDTYEDQEAFKRYAWRITEEITEALEDTEHIQHFKEEITDAFNFLIELYHLYGWRLKDLSPIEIYTNLDKSFNLEAVEKNSLELIKQLGLTCNLLKNRQWRQSQYLVDLLIFEERFKEVWKKFFWIIGACGMTKEELFDQWSLKYQVNNFRIESKY
jgi:hypothetical protein